MSPPGLPTFKRFGPYPKGAVSWFRRIAASEDTGLLRFVEDHSAGTIVLQTTEIRRESHQYDLLLFVKDVEFAWVYGVDREEESEVAQ